MAGFQEKTDRDMVQTKKVSVAILGGAFNPITLCHTQVAVFVLKAGKIFD